MKIGVVSAVTPLDTGLHRLLSDQLEIELRRHGHAAETVFMPFSGEPETLLAEMTAFYAVQFQEYYDRVIALRPVAHLIRHDAKTIWLTDAIPFYGDAQPPACADQAWLKQVKALNERALKDAAHVFAAADSLAYRMRSTGGFDAETLLPPEAGREAAWDSAIRKLLA